jgi:hypothetical protein
MRLDTAERTRKNRLMGRLPGLVGRKGLVGKAALRRPVIDDSV